MDVFSTASAVIRDVYDITMFIKRVVSDVVKYDKHQRKLQIRLDVQLLFLDSFRSLFFAGDDALLLPGRLPERALEIVLNLLNELETTLAVYKLFVIRHGITFDENSTGSPGRKDDLAVLASRWKNEATVSKIKWSIFEKNKIQRIITECEKWSGSLRDIMQHFLQVARIFNDTQSLQTFANSGKAKGVGLQEVAKRKLLSIGKPPEHFHELGGQITDKVSPTTSPLHLAQYSDGAEAITVVVEYRKYDNRLRQKHLRPEEILVLKAPIRNLAWLLQNSTFPKDVSSISDVQKQPAMYTLQCIGYADQPSKKQSCLLYSLPHRDSGDDKTSLVTLNAFIRDPQRGKPVLGSRFALAHAMALTVLNIHGSGWLHGNICSKAVVLFPDARANSFNQQTQGLQSTEKQSKAVPLLLPYLVGWQSARPLDGRTEFQSDHDVEANLYRHPERQGQPRTQFRKAYDIYALGVVLFEIGCWTSMSMVFDELIIEAENKHTLVDPKNVKKRLIETTRTEVAREMGEAYAATVLACLNEDFGVDVDDRNETELSLAFGEKVVSTLERGVSL